MNSSYVETDEEQRRWFSTVAFEQNLGGLRSVGVSSPATQYPPDGYLDYLSIPSFNYLPVLDAHGSVIQSQPEAGIEWGRSNLGLDSIPSPSDFAGGTDSSHAWPLPQAADDLDVDISVLYNREAVPLQNHSGHPLQIARPIRHVHNAIAVPEQDTKRPLSFHNSNFSSENAEPVQPAKSSETRKIDPPLIPYPYGGMPRQQSPRFDGDEYAASWVRGSGVERDAWCGFCPTWHRLKDSAYWYHMHYSHGISCVTGKPFKEPLDWRHKHGVTAYEALCGGCKEWIYIGKPERWRTPYYRHAYKCQMKHLPDLNSSRSPGKNSSPRKSKLSVRSESF